MVTPAESGIVAVEHPSPAVPFLMPLTGGWNVGAEGGSPIALLGRAPGVAVRLSGFSPEHLSFRLSSGQLLLLESPLPVRVRAAGHDLVCQAEHLDPDLATDGVLTLRILRPTRAFARDMLAMAEELEANGLASMPATRPFVRELVSEPARQREILEAMVRNGSDGTLRLGDFPVARAAPIEVRPDGTLFRIDGPYLEPPFTVELTGYNSIYVLDFDEARRTPEGVIATPKRMVRLRNRTYRRAAPPADTYVELAHPLWPEFRVRRPVREISAQGLSFRTDIREDLLYAGLHSGDVVLHVEGQTLRFSGEVKSLARVDGSTHRYCGFRLYPASPEDEARWLELVDSRLHATTKKGSGWTRATWKLYEQAGYFGLSGKDPQAFARLFDSFETVSRKIDDAPELGCQVVWPHDEREVEAAMSMLKVYASSWFVYQLAKIKGDTRQNVPGRFVLRDLHFRCYEHAQRDPELRWLIGIPQVKPTWSRMVHYDLPHRYITSGKAAIVRFRAVEIPSSGPLADPPRGLEIGAASRAERTLLLNEIARRRSPVYVDALDLVPERFELSQLNAAWNRRGLSRKRHVLVARRAGSAVAAVVLESADDGLHLFHLLNTARPFALAMGGESAFGPLLSAAAAWYEAQGKASFVAFLEDDAEIPAGTPRSAEDLGLADLVILSAEHLPELLEHVYEVTAPRLPGPVTRPPPARGAHEGETSVAILREAAR